MVAYFRDFAVYNNAMVDWRFVSKATTDLKPFDLGQIIGKANLTTGLLDRI